MEYVHELEGRLRAKSSLLEDIHLVAAIDAPLTGVSNDSEPPEAGDVTAASLSADSTTITNKDVPDKKDVMFDDYVNPDSVANCLSPYQPTEAKRIAAFFSLVNLSSEDILLDVGCGDGRVCVSAVKLHGCRAIGLDVSPPCIRMSKELAEEEHLEEHQCAFHQLDATVGPDLLLQGELHLIKLLPVGLSSCPNIVMARIEPIV